ncbi:glycosyl transferase group 1 [Parvibaculum lavamentivorans DS-1]|uniref:Glycosyl transferase group 1 n=1 Tax=Parvibaculum lavamentivorans (strain DS-1 / DSM 13023 / NCIMB 13966) TaxID=402881 RepID=A7HUF1_PARL1|nr:glycosyltransferase family 4 protein [Parvibaculum lavamentivorans]ABS63534.1 glycosyl transferase group 1 [Parvibaculum lavamentivorans DS-1]
MSEPVPKIVHVITRFVNGGADENTLLTCNHQAEAGFEVWLLYGNEFTKRMLDLLDPRVNAIAVPSLVRDASPFNDLIALVSLARLYRKIRPDIIHTHTSKAGFVGRLAALAVPRAAVVHGVHILPFTDEPFLKRTIYLLLEKVAALRTHAFIDVSDGMRDLCLANGLGNVTNHFVVRSGMDVERFRRAAPANDIATLRHETPGAVVIGYVAVLERRKRHRELLQTLLPLLGRHKSALLVMAGDGPERPLLQKMIDEAALAARVRILGFRNDVESVLAACDICVFTSQREGLPRSIVQYGLAGKPIVVTRLPGIEAVVRHGENGYVVASDDFSGFASSIEKLLENPDLRARFSQASADADLSPWDARVMGEKIHEVYAQLFSDRGGRPRGQRAWPLSAERQNSDVAEC